MRANGTPLEATKPLPALLTQRPHRAAGERQRAPSECSECSEISKISTAAPSLRHRSTRTLNPLADAPPHQASPISISTALTSTQKHNLASCGTIHSARSKTITPKRGLLVVVMILYQTRHRTAYYLADAHIIL